MTNRHRTHSSNWFIALFTFFSVLITGCGSDSGGDKTATLRGTAATGAAIVGHIEVTDANGAMLSNVSINADGSFTADVTNMSPPFILMAVPDNGGQTEYSFADTENLTVNITPLTTLAMYLANGEQDLGALASNWVTQSSQITSEALEAAKTRVNQSFSAKFEEKGLNAETYNFFSTVFNTDATGIDAVMDSISININMAENITEIKVDGVAFSFETDDSNTDNNNSIDIDSSNDTTSNYFSGDIVGIHIVKDNCEIDAGERWTLLITGTNTLEERAELKAKEETFNCLSVPEDFNAVAEQINELYSNSIADSHLTHVSSSDTEVIYESTILSTWTNGVSSFTTSEYRKYTFTKN